MKNPFNILCLFICSLGVACHEEEIESGFVTTSAIGNEGDGTQSIVIDLGQVTTTGTTITFTVAGNAALDGDYTVDAISDYAVDAPYKIYVREGESTATISIDLIDDHQIEPRNEVIYFQITDVSDKNIANTMKRTLFAYEIEDNDTSPASGMQVDMSWILGDNVRVNASNLDLYLASSIILSSNGEVASFVPVSQYASKNETGFESYVIDETIEDHEYYIIIHYVSGTYDGNVSLELSQGSSHGAASGRIAVTYVGKYAYYGPITKSGTKFDLN